MKTQRVNAFSVIGAINHNQGVRGKILSFLSHKKVLVLVSLPIFLLQARTVLAAPQKIQIQSFSQWCQQQNSLPASTKHTIKVLLTKAGTQNCQKADSKLRSMTDLEFTVNDKVSDLNPLAGLNNLTFILIGGSPIRDLKPLAGLRNLTILNLGNNEISDVNPLAGLNKLTFLHLDGNQISDVKPLAGLKKLTTLFLSSNQISDVTPLAGLSNLTELYIYNNQISDVKPFAGLSHLTALDLSNNKISDVNPLTGLIDLKVLSLLSNQVRDVKPLAKLINLTQLNLGDNPISVKNCPIKPVSICKFGFIGLPSAR
jgi:internalin A